MLAHCIIYILFVIQSYYATKFVVCVFFVCSCCYFVTLCSCVVVCIEYAKSMLCLSIAIFYVYIYICVYVVYARRQSNLLTYSRRLNTRYLLLFACVQFALVNVDVEN